MNSLIRFNLKRRYRSKLMIVFNVMIFIVIFILFHLDYLVDSKTASCLVYIDSSCESYMSYFEELNDESHSYQYSNEENEWVVHKWNDHWEIVGLDDEQMMEMIKNDIHTVIVRAYEENHRFLREYIDEYNQLIETSIPIETDQMEDYTFLVVLSISYFLIMNFSMVISSEVIYEKGTHVATILFTNISALEQLLSKIILSYLIPVIQIVIIVVMGIVNGIIRYVEDGFVGIIHFASQFIQIEASDKVVSYTLFPLMVIGILMLTSLVIIQILIMIISSRFTSQDQSAAFSGIIYVIMLMLYFFFMSLNQNTIQQLTAIPLLSYLPIANMLFMSERMLQYNATELNGIIAIIINLLMIAALVQVSLKSYKRNLLNQNK